MTFCPIVVYNVQRLFRPTGSPIARELDVTEERGWTKAMYRRKVEAVATMLVSATSGVKPSLLVLIEVEDGRVVKDICAAAGWHDLVDITVPNEQIDGYDVAIAYDPARFSAVSDERSFTFENRFAKRDLLVATLHLNDTRELTVCATHWASRKMSDAEVLRIGAAIFCNNTLERRLKFGKEEILDEIGRPRLPSLEDMKERWSTPILVAGDLNDNPWDRSVSSLLDSTPDPALATRPPRFPSSKATNPVAAYLSLRPRLYNPTWELLTSPPGEPKGTYRFGPDWYALDQILISAGMLGINLPTLRPHSLRVHRPKSLRGKGRRLIHACAGDGTPIPFNPETGVGISDHLPLIAELDL